MIFNIPERWLNGWGFPFEERVFDWSYFFYKANLAIQKYVAIMFWICMCIKLHCIDFILYGFVLMAVS